MAVIVHIEWRVPWDKDWAVPKKVTAAERLVSYIKNGSFYNTAERIHVIAVEVHQMHPHSDPVIRIAMEI